MNSSRIKKFALGLIVALPAMLALDVVQFLAVLQLVDAHRAVAHTTGVLREVEGALSGLNSAETATRGYIITGREEYQGIYQSAVSEARAALRRLTQLTAGGARQQERLRRLEPLVASRMDLLKQTFESRRQREFSIEKQRPAEAEGQRLMVGIRKVIDDMKVEEEALLQKRDAAARTSVRKTIFVLTFVAALALWLVALAALLVYRRAAEQRWAGVERRMHTRVLATMPLGVCLTDENGIIFYTNPAEDAMFGYEPYELIGKDVTTLSGYTQGERGQVFDDIGSKVQRGETWMGELTSRRKDGSTFPCFLRVNAVDLPERLYRVFLHEDVTQQKRT